MCDLNVISCQSCVSFLATKKLMGERFWEAAYFLLYICLCLNIAMITLHTEQNHKRIQYIKSTCINFFQIDIHNLFGMHSPLLLYMTKTCMYIMPLFYYMTKTYMYVKTGFGSKSIFSFLDILAFENQRRWSQHLSLGHHFTSISKENLNFIFI